MSCCRVPCNHPRAVLTAYRSHAAVWKTVRQPSKRIRSLEKLPRSIKVRLTSLALSGVRIRPSAMPCSVAAAATGDGFGALPRPRRRSGCVTTAATCSEEDQPDAMAPCTPASFHLPSFSVQCLTKGQESRVAMSRSSGSAWKPHSDECKHTKGGAARWC